MSTTATNASNVSDVERLTADERRATLLDVAKEIVVVGGPEAVTMGTVAQRAGVTRTLVYKHFGNRDDMLVALYRREASALDRTMRDVVLAAGPGLESKLRALVDSILDSADEYGSFFRLLRQVSTTDTARSDRRGWDRRTLLYFAGLVQEETSLDDATARIATSLLLTPLQTLRSQTLADPTSRDRYVDVYLDVVLGAIERLDRRGATSRSSRS